MTLKNAAGLTLVGTFRDAGTKVYYLLLSSLWHPTPPPTLLHIGSFLHHRSPSPLPEISIPVAHWLCIHLS